MFDLLTEFWNSGNLELLPQLFSEDVERSDPDHPQPIRGRQEIANYMAEVRTGFPDFKIELKRQIGEGDQVAVEWTCTGTHNGVFQGIPATGRRANVAGVSLYRIKAGKIVEERAYFDRLALLQQLGVIPEAAQSKTTSAGR